MKSFVTFFLKNKLLTWLCLIFILSWGAIVAPFNLGIDWLPRNSVSIDAIPDIGENQQIVFTSWEGRSPQNVEDQITFPLTSSLLGIPGVKSVRSNSMFGFSSIYLIFEEDVEFYWSRSRILEKLNALPSNLLPEGVSPSLGPDATALGQIYWYTLEGRDENNNPTGEWNPEELRSIQDFYVKYGLLASEGVAEVASIGGYVKEYRVDIDPLKMKAKNITLSQVMKALKESNLDIGAQTIEINKAEYFVRGLGYVMSIDDISSSVINQVDGTPIVIGDIATVYLGPASRRGILDKSGAEAVGGVVVARYGANPLEVINNVKKKINEIGPGLPSKILADGTKSQVTIVPFYDRTQLINETIGTLEEALTLEILITIIVVILLLFHLQSSLLVAGSLPIAVMMCFIAMKYFGVDANIVALSGIAIAIGTMVDMGIVLTESIIDRNRKASPDESLFTTVYEATMEVGSAVLTAVATTVISFLPVFAMEAAEGKLFRPLAYTKTFALIAAVLVALAFIPPLAHSMLQIKVDRKKLSLSLSGLAFVASILFYLFIHHSFILIVTIISGFLLLQSLIDLYFSKGSKLFRRSTIFIYALLISIFLSHEWMPLGVNNSLFTNTFFVVLLIAALLSFFWLIIRFYEAILRFLLKVKLLFLLIIGVLIYSGFYIFQRTGQEFMPALDEGSFLLMPTSMPHSGIAENIKNLRLLDMAVTAIPEVESVLGKAGRVDSPLDPAPLSMYENIINYKSEYRVDEKGHRKRFKYEKGEFQKDKNGNLIPDPNGKYYRQWRDHIHSPDDIWNEIIQVTKLPGVTSAPKLQPIETRLIMLQTGMRAPMGIKVKGQNLKEIERIGRELENHLKRVDGVKSSTVFAEKIVGKPYLLLDINREALSTYGLTMASIQNQIQSIIGGMTMSTTVEGRERYAIRIRYPLDARSDIFNIQHIYIDTPIHGPIPLSEVVDIKYEQGPQSIKSEDGFLVGYVLFDKQEEFAEVDVVLNAKKYIQDQIDVGELEITKGINYHFSGNYEQQLRANKRLALVIPVALALIFIILYLQFRSVVIALMVFLGVFVAFAGGFIMIGLYNTDWFLDFALMGINGRDLFHIQGINLSVAVWVGFLALFGIATDDGVLVATFLKDSFKKNNPTTIPEIRDAVVQGGLRRVRPAMMTTATTLLALLPVLTSTGRGSDIMIPMAIPSFGGMALQVVTMFTVPILFSMWKEGKLIVDKKWNKMNRNTFLFSFIMILSVGIQAQSLDELIEKARTYNPGLKALQLEYKADLQKENQAKDWPDPIINLGIGVLPIETRLGAQLLNIGISQKIPWKGKLEAKQKSLHAQAEVKAEMDELQEIEIEYAIRTNYVMLTYLQEQSKVITEKLNVLDALEDIATSAVRSGKGKLSDVLLIQRKREELLIDQRLIEKKKEQPTIRINRWTGSDLTAPINIITPENKPFLKDELVKYAQENHPKQSILSKQKLASQARKEYINYESKPQIGVGLSYAYIEARDDITIDQNGRDVLMPMGTLSIPIHKSRFEAKRQEETIRQEAIDAYREETTELFLAEINMAMSQLEYAEQLLQKFVVLEDITKETLTLMRTEYASEGTRFDELLRLEMELINYNQERIKAERDKNMAWSILQKYR
ncbi:MAG: efflux RND transporter permease subunit [Saprospiraceae bacterium]|nr:efflux RND transporter permease subunit [Saprospiraceae bacterium]